LNRGQFDPSKLAMKRSGIFYAFVEIGISVYGYYQPDAKIRSEESYISKGVV